MKKKKLLVFLFSLSFTYCNKSENKDLLEIIFKPDYGYLIPTTRATCEDKKEGLNDDEGSASPYSVNFRNFSLIWSGDLDLNILFMSVEIKGNPYVSDLEYILTSDDLHSMFEGNDASKYENRMIKKASSEDNPTIVSLKPTVDCDFVFGGVSIKAQYKDTPFIVPVTVMLRGFVIDGDIDIPVKQTGLIYIKNE